MFLLRLFFYFIFVLIIGCGSSSEEKGNKATKTSTPSSLIPDTYKNLSNVFAGSGSANYPYKMLFERDLTFKGDNDHYISPSGEFAVDDRGNVFVTGENGIIVFDSEGNIIKKLGRRGRGPGEFLNMTSLSPKIRKGNLYTYDDVLGRIQVFDLKNLEFSNSIIINSRQINVGENVETSIQRLVDVTDNALLFEYEDIRTADIEKEIFRRYYLVDQNGDLFSEEVLIIQYKNPNNTKAYYFGPQNFFFPLPNASDRQTRINFDSNNNIYTSWTEDFFIKIFNPQGKYQRSVFYPYQNSSLNEEEIIDSFKYNEEVYQRARKYKYPETWPAIDRFFVDDEDRIWVATITDDVENYEWWVLKSSGELISKFKWPGKRIERARRFRIKPLVKDGYFYLMETDQNTGDSYLARYKITFKQR